MRIPPTLPPPRAISLPRNRVRRWGIRIRAQRSEHGYGPPAAAGIMSTATSEPRAHGELSRGLAGEREREREGYAREARELPTKTLAPTTMCTPDPDASSVITATPVPRT